MTPRPDSGRYTPQRLHSIVVEARRFPWLVPAILAEHRFSEDEWREVNRRFDMGELRVTRLQSAGLRRAA